MIFCLGETLLDIVQDASSFGYLESPAEAPGIPGGAMLNASVSLARARMPVSLITELGDDDVATFIIRFLKNNGINTQWVRQYSEMQTSVAIAVLDQNKKATYHFEKHYPTHRKLMSIPHFTGKDVVLFGSLYSLEEGIRSELLKTLHAARQAGSTIVYDPNIRQDTITRDSKQWKKIIENIKIADIIKASDDDLRALFGKESPEKLLRTLSEINPWAPAIMTMGASGVLCLWKNKLTQLPAKKITIKSTVGAGDGFNAGFIYKWVQAGFTKDFIPTIGYANIVKLLQSGISFSSAICESEKNYIPTDFISNNTKL